MALVIDIISFMMLVLFIGKRTEKIQMKHYIFIAFVVLAQLVIAIIIVFTKQRPQVL